MASLQLGLAGQEITISSEVGVAYSSLPAAQRLLIAGVLRSWLEHGGEPDLVGSARSLYAESTGGGVDTSEPQNRVWLADWLIHALQVGTLRVQRHGPMQVFERTRSTGGASPRTALGAPSDETDPDSPAPARSWITIALVDERGQAVPNERYRIELPDGSVREGQLNASGRAHIDDIDPGQCRLTFTSLDGSEWRNS